jgi:hypothetical protein
LGTPRCGPCLPFYSSQGEGSDYICGKEEKEKKKKKNEGRVASGVAIFIQREQFVL